MYLPISYAGFCMRVLLLSARVKETLPHTDISSLNTSEVQNDTEPSTDQVFSVVAFSWKRTQIATTAPETAFFVRKKNTTFTGFKKHNHYWYSKKTQPSLGDY